MLTTRPGLLKLFICLLLGLGTVVIYAPVRHYAFVKLDDDDYITQNPHVIFGLTRGNVGWAFTHFRSSNWHPLTWLSHILDVQLWGLNAGGHHLTSVVFHALTAVLLFLVFTSMTEAPWQSAFVAAVFAWHPLHVESVAWISERKDVLSAFFWVLTMAAYVYYIRKPQLLRYALVMALFACGLMSKPMLVTLPLVLLLLDYWPLGRAGFAGNDVRKWFNLILEKAPLFALAALSALITLSTQLRSGAMRSSLEFPWPARVSNAVVAYVDYLWHFIWPAKLAVFYPFPSSIPLWQSAGAGLLLAAITTATILLTKRHPYLSVGWLWYIGTLIPVIGLIKVGEQAMADRYTYLPLIGVSIMVGWGAPEILEKTQRPKFAAQILFAAIAFLLILATQRQLRYWHDSFTLFHRAISVTSDNWLAHNNLSNALLDQPGELEAAKHEALEALRIRPNYPQANLNLGVILLRQGDTPKAILYLEKAAAGQPSWSDAHFNLGAALMVAGKVNEAIAQFYQTLRLDPDSVPALKALAWIRSTQSTANLRNAQEALTLARHAARLTRYRDPEVLDVLAAALAEAGDFAEATKIAGKARGLAVVARKDRLIPLIQDRIELYQLHLPYRANSH